MSISSYNNINRITFDSLSALNNSVLCTDMEFKERKLNSGIILGNDNGTSAGIRPRWGKVYAVGPTHANVKVGQYVLLAHGRWTRGVNVTDAEGDKTIRKVDPDDILLVSNVLPSDESMTTALV